MNPSAPITHALINAVRRRIILLRIAESIGVGCAAASIAGSALMPIVWWRGKSELTMGQVLLALGAVCGLIWGFASRPTPLAAAAEADRQLGLEDLLGTVLLMCHSPADNLTTPQWRQTLLAISEARCRQLRASAVIVNRLGMRTWGGIGVLVAGLLTLCLFIAQPPDSRASIDLQGQNAQENSPPGSQDTADQIAADQMGRPAGSGGVDQDFRRNLPNDQTSFDSSESSAAAGKSSNAARSGNGDRGEGAGMARTNTRSHAALGPDGAGDSASGSAGPLGAGSGSADASAKGSGPAGISVASPDHPAPADAPPWQAPQWSSDTAAAREGIRDGRVPDSAADLVRDYFQRD
jgi:hypothetical protein